MVSRWLLTLSAVMMGAAVVSDAQQVRGIVSDGRGSPLSGVLLQLLDSASIVVAQGLSSDRGAYRLRAPRPGTYIVRSLRIGFRPRFSEPLALLEESDLTRDLSLSGIALSLDTVRVGGRASCHISRDSALQSFIVLEQARSALIATRLSDQAVVSSVTHIVFERDFDSLSPRPVAQRSVVRSGASSAPWRSLSADSLHATGYVRSDADSIVYLAPGLDVLSDASFMEDHCFRLVAADDDREIGLAFEPTPARRRIPEISGTLWLERSSAWLKRLDFHFVNAPVPDQERDARGELAFVRMNNGAWAIASWKLRMPVLEQRRRVRAGRRAGSSAILQDIVVVGIREVGGVLLSARIGTDTSWVHAPIRVAGRVTDSTGQAVAAARVLVGEQRLEGLTGRDGRFEIRGIHPGELDLEVHTSPLDSLSTFLRQSVVAVDSIADLDVRLPTLASVLKSMCGATRARVSTPGLSGIVLATLSMAGAPRLPTRVQATVEWMSADGVPHWIDARPNREGGVHFCGVPVGRALILSASADSAGASPVQLRILEGQRVVRTTVVLDPAIAVGATFSGVVVRDSSEQPVPGVEIVLPGLAKSQATTEQGLYRLRDIPAGVHRVIARKMGYGPADTSISFLAGASVIRRIVLTPMSVLDEVVVTAVQVDPRMREFDDNRRLGLGHFLTRGDLAKIESGVLAQALEQLPGLQLVHAQGTANRAFVTSMRGRRSSTCTPVAREGAKDDCGPCYAQVYLDNLPLFTGRANTEVPDINRFLPSQVEAVEYYASAAQAPARYSGLNSMCGVLVVHTRRSP